MEKNYELQKPYVFLTHINFLGNIILKKKIYKAIQEKLGKQIILDIF